MQVWPAISPPRGSRSWDGEKPCRRSHVEGGEIENGAAEERHLGRASEGQREVGKNAKSRATTRRVLCRCRPAAANASQSVSSGPGDAARGSWRPTGDDRRSPAPSHRRPWHGPPPSHGLSQPRAAPACPVVPAHRAPAFSDSSGGRQPLRRFPSLRRAVISANGRVFPTSPAATTAFPASHAHTLLAKRHSSPAALADQFPANLSPRLGDSVATARVRA